MHWSDTAIVLSARKHGENSVVARLLSREHGVYSGVVRAAHSKTVRGILQPGNIVSATWSARLSEQLGNFKAELMEPVTALVMGDAGRLCALTCTCALIESALPERHPYAHLYGVLTDFLHELITGKYWQAAYVHLEMELLAEAGFGLDLSSCAATGTTDDLIYVSPKSGRAVCREAGEPYKDKLLKLPSFLVIPAQAGIHLSNNADPRVKPGDDKNNTNPAEILAGIQLTGYFLQHWLLEPHRRKLPAARTRLIHIVKEYSLEKDWHAAETASA